MRFTVLDFHILNTGKFVLFVEFSQNIDYFSGTVMSDDKEIVLRVATPILDRKVRNGFTLLETLEIVKGHIDKNIVSKRFSMV